MKKILYIDLDGVCADFDAAINKLCPELETDPKYLDLDVRSAKVDELCQKYPNIFQYLEPIEGSVEGVNILFEHFEVYFLSTPMWEVLRSFMDKRFWIERIFGSKVKKRLILSHRKDLAIGDYLIDDRTKNGAGEFKGEHIHFRSDSRFMNWPSVVEYLLNKECK